MHAGESETSMQEPGADQARVKLPEGLYTGIWWYARFPNHYAGEGAAVKADQESLRLQNEFCERSKHPLETPQ